MILWSDTCTRPLGFWQCFDTGWAEAFHWSRHRRANLGIGSAFWLHRIGVMPFSIPLDSRRSLSWQECRFIQGIAWLEVVSVKYNRLPLFPVYLDKDFWLSLLPSFYSSTTLHLAGITFRVPPQDDLNSAWAIYCLQLLQMSSRAISPSSACLGVSCRSENMAAQQICHECGLARPSWQVPCGRKRSLCEMQTWNWWNFQLWSYEGNWKPKLSIMLEGSISKIRVTQQIAERVIYVLSIYDY